MDWSSQAGPCPTQDPAAEPRDGVEHRPLQDQNLWGSLAPWVILWSSQDWGFMVLMPALHSGNSWIPVGCPTVQFGHSHYLPGGRLSPTTPPQPQIPVKIQVVTCASEWLGTQVRVSQDPLLRFQRFAGALSELGETFCLIDCWLIVKGCNSTAWWKRCSRQGIGKQVRLQALPKHTSLPKSPRVYQPRGLSESRVFRYLWASLHKPIDYISDNWRLIQFPAPFPSWKVRGGIWEMDYFLPCQ